LICFNSTFTPRKQNSALTHHPRKTMSLTANVLDRLDTADANAAADLVRASDDGVDLIELLEMLWSIDNPRAKPLIAPVLERLGQLRPRQ
jgi:hypothetical protein